MNKEMPNNKVIVPTGIKLTGVKLTDKWMEYKSKMDSIQIKFCALFTKWVRENKVKAIIVKNRAAYIHFNEEVWSGKFEKSKKDEHPKDVLSLRHLKYHPEIQKIIFDVLGVKSLSELTTSPLDDSLWYVTERFASYVNRNSTRKAKKFPKRGITLKTNKATYFKNNSIKINAEDKTITIKTCFKKNEIKLTYSGSKYNNESGADGQWCGGNIVYNSLLEAPDNELVLLAYVEHDDFPEATHIVGMDVNRKVSDWITFSEPISNGEMRLEKPNNIIDLEKIRDMLNAQLRPKRGAKISFKLNSRQRKTKYGTLHKKKENRKTAIAAVLIPELEYLKKIHGDKLGVAIDGVATGKSMASFGQEDIRDICVKWCLKTKTAFRPVPPEYTSQRCPECGSFHKQDRKTSNTFNCPTCGYFHENCDELGALNIKIHGEFLFKSFKITSSSLSTEVKNPDGGKRIVLRGLYKDALAEEFNFPKKKNPAVLAG